MPTLPATVDGIAYTAQGAYADLDFAALGGVYLTPASVGPRIGTIGPRRVLVDTSGKVLLVRGCMRATNDDTHLILGGQQSGRTLNSNLATKYQGPGTTWVDATSSRFHTFHFNVVGNTSGAFNTGGQMVVIFTTGGAFDAMVASRMHQVNPALEPIKDLVQATNFASGSGGRLFGDVFDPKYATFIAGWVGNQVFADPKILCFWSDDGDHVSALGGSGHPNEVGFTDVESNFGFHAGMVALIGRLTVTSQTSNDTTIGFNTWTTDTVNHTKRALLDFLIGRYGTIAALNAAWGTGGFYTSFETQPGGFGVGTGLADEDGARAHAWMGSAVPGGFPQNGGPNNLVDSTRWGLTGTTVTSTFGAGSVKAMKEDLDQFMYNLFEAYLKPIHDVIKAQRPGALFAGSNGGSPGRAPGLKAINTYCDILMGSGYFASGNSHILNPVAKAQTDFERGFLTIPYFTSYYTACQADSSVYYLGGDPLTDTQAAMGAKTASVINAGIAYQAPDGTYPIVGGLKWGLYDQPAETGWGIFSYNDDPYDGRDYRLAQPDPYTPGRTTLTEDRVYGDQLTAVKNAHIQMFTTLQSQIGAVPSPPSPPLFLNEPYHAGDTTVVGTGVVGASIALYRNAVLVAGVVTVAGSGVWTYPTPPLGAGEVLTATQTTVNGTSALSLPSTVLAAPAPPPLIQANINPQVVHAR